MSDERRLTPNEISELLNPVGRELKAIGDQLKQLNDGVLKLNAWKEYNEKAIRDMETDLRDIAKRLGHLETQHATLNTQLGNNSGVLTRWGGFIGKLGFALVMLIIGWAVGNKP